jgi:integrase
MQDRTPRSHLKPYLRGKTWYARGYVAIRNGNSLTRTRVERSAGQDCRTKAQAQKFCDDLNRMFEERALSSKRPLTFSKAMMNYLDLGKTQPKKAAQLLKFFGTTLVSEIDNTMMLEAKRAIFPDGAKAPYVNRHLYTPMVAILRLAAKDKACDVPMFERPEGYTKHPPVQSPQDDAWYRIVVPELNPDAAALVTLLTVYGRRISEFLKLAPADFDVERSTLSLGRTKNGREVFLRLDPRVVEIMKRMPGWETRRHLFRYKPRSGVDAVNKLIRETCARLGVPYYSTHKLGRHRFALRMLDKGYSLQHVKDSGGWETISILSDRYGSRAHSELTETIHEAGGALLDGLKSGE